MIEQKEISKDFIQEKYMQLLEESYISEQTKLNFVLKNIIPILSFIAIIGFISFYFLKPSINKELFLSNLVETPYNTNSVLLENNKGAFFKIPQQNNKDWVTETGISINIDSDKITLKSIGKKKYNQSFKIHTPQNKIYNLTLPDLSKIKINSNSIVTINLFADQKIPNIELTGEAFFNIAKQTSRTFNILANKMNIEVVGTEFNISNYKNQLFTQLSLVEGKVKIKNNTKINFINAGQQATMYEGEKNLIIKNKDFSNDLSWLHNNIYFENKPLIEISKIIENWFNINFIFSNNKIKSIHFTGKLEKEKGLTHFLQMLKYTEKLKYSINKKTITLSDK